MKYLMLSTACLAIIASTPALAEKKDEIENTLVTATRTEQSYASTLASVTVFDRADIDNFQVQSLPDILAKAAGVSLSRNGGRGAVASISLRGNQSDHTLFLVNGLRVGSATLGITPIELLDPEQIERIEIVRGPKSSLYGSDALGGVINIITRQANSAQPLRIKTSVGNNNSKETSIGAGYNWATFSASITANTISTEGNDNTESTTHPHEDDDGLEQDTLGIDLAYAPLTTLKLGLNYQYSDSETEYDVSCTDSTTFVSVQCSPYTESTVEIGQLSGRWQVNDFWASQLSLGYSKSESEEFAREIDINTTFNGGIFNTERTDAKWQNDFQISKQLLLTAGYDYLNEEVSGTTDYDVSERENDAVYLQALWHAGQFSGNVGARNDDNEQFGSKDTFTATAGYQLDNGIKLIASYGEAFKAPTFNDLYYPNFGDPTLVPEESDTYELAVQHLAAEVEWSLRLYKNRVDNLIQYNSVIFANDQIASATIEGMEIALTTRLYGWDLNSAFTLLDTEDDTTGNELARRPKRVFNLDLDRQFGRWSVGSTLYAASSRYNDAANLQEFAGYATVALRGAYKPTEAWTLQLKADNIFEKEYFLSSGFLGKYQQPGLEVLFSVVYTPSF